MTALNGVSPDNAVCLSKYCAEREERLNGSHLLHFAPFSVFLSSDVSGAHIASISRVAQFVQVLLYVPDVTLKVLAVYGASTCAN